MTNRWDAREAEAFTNDPVAMRVFTSQLLGSDPELVLHGGGNTSVKIREKTFFGDEEELIYVKGSGWDLATIEKAGFAPLRIAPLLRLSDLETLSDTDMVTQQRAAMTVPTAPDASIEAIVHAVIPFSFVDHTHANAVVALTNSPDGEARVREVYGDRVLVLPYVMPGFVLAKAVSDLIADKDLSDIEGIILMNHGIFTFADDAKTSYDRMIELVSEAEAYLARRSVENPYASTVPVETPLLELSALRKEVSALRGCPVLVSLDCSPEAVGFSLRDDIESLATRGPLTPDHSIRTKRIPAVIGENIEADLSTFARNYRTYFDTHSDGSQTMLDPAPRWAVWKGHGVASFGTTAKEVRIISDIARHTMMTVQLADATGGWRALPEKDIFEIEYWELEQAKLKRAAVTPPLFQGKVALVTGAAAGIGFASAESLARQGATVIGIDLAPEIATTMGSIRGIGFTTDLTDDEQVQKVVAEIVALYGGIDVIVSNAGIFTAGQYLQDLASDNWDKSMAVNLTSHQKLLKYSIPFLKNGCDAAVVLVGSRNVNAPGAGAASYSCAKAGLNQLARVAALELAPEGVRCNIIHPDAVFDTKLWTPEMLARSAERYGLSVEEYKTRNLMKTEIRSKDVGNMIAAMASPLFGKTTGAQIPVDGGNDRVI